MRARSTFIALSVFFHLAAWWILAAMTREPVGSMWVVLMLYLGSVWMPRS